MFMIIAYLVVHFEGEISKENTHDFCMAFAQCTNEFGLTLMQWPITITSKSDLKSKAKSFSTWLIYIQGRKWLPKTGWASSNVAHLCRRAAAWRRLLFRQKLGGQLPTLPTRHLRP